MNHYYTLDLELWQNSDEARAEAEKIFDFEPIPKDNLLLKKHTIDVMFSIQGRFYNYIDFLQKFFVKQFKHKLQSLENQKAFLVPVISYVVEFDGTEEILQQEDLLEEAFVAYIQNLVQENTNLFHRFIFKVNA